MSKRRKPNKREVQVAVVMTIRVDPEQENVGTYTVEFDVEGAEIVVEILGTAYKRGALTHGINAFTDAVARALGPQPSEVHLNAAGRA